MQSSVALGDRISGRDPWQRLRPWFLEAKSKLVLKIKVYVELWEE